jgi:hypothetical protein
MKQSRDCRSSGELISPAWSIRTVTRNDATNWFDYYILFSVLCLAADPRFPSGFIGLQSVLLGMSSILDRCAVRIALSFIACKCVRVGVCACGAPPCTLSHESVRIKLSLRKEKSLLMLAYFMTVEAWHDKIRLMVDWFGYSMKFALGWWYTWLRIWFHQQVSDASDSFFFFVGSASFT